MVMMMVVVPTVMVVVMMMIGEPHFAARRGISALRLIRL